MSCPVTAGVVALMLERNPYLSAAEIASIIKQTAYTDGFTGTLPTKGDVTWGHGKLDAWAALKAVRDTSITSRPGQQLPKRYVLFPNPVSGQSQELQVIQPTNLPTTYSVYDLTGKIVFSQVLPPAKLQNIVMNLRPGAYFIKLSDDLGVEIHKLIVQ
jgi:subtilisin family serine protease